MGVRNARLTNRRKRAGAEIRGALGSFLCVRGLGEERGTETRAVWAPEPGESIDERMEAQQECRCAHEGEGGTAERERSKERGERGNSDERASRAREKGSRFLRSFMNASRDRGRGNTQLA